MIGRFYLYSIFKNLRFADPFLIIIFLDAGLSYLQIGWLFGAQHLVTVLLEFPSGVMADHWGRRRCLAVSFLCYTSSFLGFSLSDYSVEPPSIAWFGGCLAFFAVGEAFRTGSHKAIVLDYLGSRGQVGRATEVLGKTRSVSKLTSAATAICGGLLLFWLRDFEVLFLSSAAGSACGFLLMLTYPRELEREHQRARPWQRLPMGWPIHEGLHQPGRKRLFWALVVQSVLFESQVKVILKYYLQPFLNVGLASLGIAIATSTSISGIHGSGAVWIGLNEFVRDSLGGLGARLSPRFEEMAGSRKTALNGVYLGALGAVMGVGVCSLDLRVGLLPGLLLMIGLTILQNLRRPVFVAALNGVMQKSRRASALSLESVARAIVVAVLLPLYGLAADSFGLVSVWVLSASFLLVGLLLSPSLNESRGGNDEQ